MRSIFAGLAVTVALSLGACGAKPATGGEGKECKDLFEKFDGWCKDAKDPIKGYCESNKAGVEGLKKLPNEEACKVLNTGYKTIKDAAGAVPTGDPAATPASAPGGEVAPSSAPAEGEGAGSAPAK